MLGECAQEDREKAFDGCHFAVKVVIDIEDNAAVVGTVANGMGGPLSAIAVDHQTDEVLQHIARKKTNEGSHGHGNDKYKIAGKKLLLVGGRKHKVVDPLLACTQAGEDQRAAEYEISIQQNGAEQAHCVSTARRRLEEQRDHLGDDHQP